MTSGRGRDVKVFRNEDCTFTALFGHYLHYEKVPGQWEEVDLEFRPDGAGYVMDRHDIEVRITGATLKATERESGKGIRWVMPMPPVVAGRSARYSEGGLQWEYTTTKPGLKLAANVPAPLGQRTWEFPYHLEGGAADLSLDEEGNLQSDAFSVPRPFALGADGKTYEVGGWRLLPGSRVAFDFSDQALPPEAFPYELDPSTTFSVALGSHDGYVRRTGVAYPPPPHVGKFSADFASNTSVISPTRSVVETCQPAPESTGATGTWAMALCPEYTIENALIRWDTSSLPDNAVISAGTLRAYASVNYDADYRSLTADWYTAWPIDEADYTETTQTSAHAGTPLSAITGGQTDFALSGPAVNVSKTGYTGLRLHVSGGEPTGRNQVNLRAYEHPSGPEPQLLVTYTTPPQISSASDTPDPVTAGDPITFTVSWTDADPGDTVRAVICKTNQVSSGSCPGGSWAVGSLSSTSPSTASFTPTAANHGTKTYYAFACDASGLCSSSVSSTFVVQNRTPSISAASDSPDPVTAGNSISFSTSWSDPGDSVRAVICKTDQVSSGSCPGGSWAVGSLSSTSPSAASFIPTAANHGTKTYYAFACDAAGLCSNSVSGTFTVQNRTPSISSASDSPDPVTAGDSIVFSAAWSDLGDSVQAVICKTSQVSAGACPGGPWAVGGLSSSSPSTASFTPSSAHAGNQTYYAFVCDAAGACSPYRTGAFTVQTRPPAISSVSDSPDPVTAGASLTFSVSWTDADPDDSVRAVVCKTNQVSAGSCPGGAWAIGSTSATSPSTASFTPTAANHGTKTYYAFACDASGACSGSVSGSFEVQNAAPTASSASDNPDPAAPGDTITFSVSWADPDDSSRAVICKTDAVDSGTCPGGEWAVGNLLTDSPATASLNTTAALEGTRDYYAFACDAGDACSSSNAGTFTVEARAPSIASAGDSPDPVNATKMVTFTVDWSDPTDAIRAVICKTNQVSGGTCPGGAWAVGTPSSSSPSTATYKTKSNEGGEHTYFAFVCDAGGLCSSGIEGSFRVVPVVSIVTGTSAPDIEAGWHATYYVQFQTIDVTDEYYYALICRTSSMDPVERDCLDGQQLAKGTPRQVDWEPGNTATVSTSHQTATSWIGSHEYYAFVCDSYTCSPNSVRGQYSVRNMEPILKSNYPPTHSPDETPLYSDVTFTAWWNDTAGEGVRIVLCGSAGMSIDPNCTALRQPVAQGDPSYCYQDNGSEYGVVLCSSTVSFMTRQAGWNYVTVYVCDEFDSCSGGIGHYFYVVDAGARQPLTVHCSQANSADLRPGDEVYDDGNIGAVVPAEGHSVIATATTAMGGESLSVRTSSGGQVQVNGCGSEADGPDPEDAVDIPTNPDSEEALFAPEGDECENPTYLLLQGRPRWTTTMVWYFNRDSTPRYLKNHQKVNKVEEALHKAADSIVGTRTSCQLLDVVPVGHYYAGSTTAYANIYVGADSFGQPVSVCGVDDGVSVVDFGALGGLDRGRACVFAHGDDTIEEVDIRLRLGDSLVKWEPDAAGGECVKPDHEYSVLGVAAHEFGHAYGLADLTKEHRYLTMRSFQRKCNDGPSTLGLGDVMGLADLYP